MSALLLSMLNWILALALPITCSSRAGRKLAAWFVVVLTGTTFGVFYKDWMPWERLVYSTAGLLFAMKCLILLSQERLPHSRAGLLLYSIWPGMDPKSFDARSAEVHENGQRFVRGLIRFYVGAALLLASVLTAPALSSAALGWLGVFGLLTMVHFGLADMLTSLLGLLRWPARPLFEQPWRSRTLAEFWSARWNLAFVEMDRLLFMRPLSRRLGVRAAVFAVFLLSGVLHELAISYPAGGGWGLPMLYFGLQGGAVLFERRFRIKSRIWTWSLILLPLPILFHGPFREALVQPMLLGLNTWATSRPIDWYMSIAIWILGIAQLLVLAASFQVPSRLRWKEELPCLSAFNQKLMWTYGLFIVGTITGFGVLTLLLRHEFLSGNRVAVALAIFICLFWILRIVVDTFYFKHEDWPKGPQFRVGHALLNSLFVFLILGYGCLAMYGTSRGSSRREPAHVLSTYSAHGDESDLPLRPTR